MSTISKTIKENRTVLIRPHLTEKATMAASGKNPVFIFEVIALANKSEVSKEVEKKYKVKPTRVNIVNLPRKQVTVRGKKGFQTAIKKALVYLKPGEKIELV